MSIILHCCEHQAPTCCDAKDIHYQSSHQIWFQSLTGLSISNDHGKRFDTMTVDQSQQKYLFWLPTGGFTHMMCSLSSCVSQALRNGRKVIPLTEKHDVIGCNFFSFFRLSSTGSVGGARFAFATPEEAEWAIKNYSPPHPSMPSQIDQTFISGHLADSHGRHRYIINNILSIDGDEWYLDPLSSQSWDDKQFLLSWGHFESYWPSMLHELLEDVLFSRGIQEIVIEKVNHALTNLGQRYLSVHFRNTDYKSHFERTAYTALSYCSDYRLESIYWATDDMSSLDRAIAFFREHSIQVLNETLSIDISKISDAVALHALPKNYLYSMGLRQSDFTIQFLIDVFLCACSHEFIGSSGTVPFLIETFRANNNKLLKKHMLE